LKNLRGVEVYFPVRDVGVDLLVVKGSKHVGIQVKESRYYTNYRWKSGHIGHSWHKVRWDKLVKDKERVSFYVFITYLPSVKGHRIGFFENRFLVVPTAELERRLEVKKIRGRNMYCFCFHFEGEHVYDEDTTVDISDERADYSRFLDAWHLIAQALE